MKLLLMGAQCSGKGTAAEVLTKLLNIPTISTGELFREVSSSGSGLGRQIRDIINSGALVPDDLTLKMLKERLSKDDCKNGYILDGFPRTLEQAKQLENLTKIDKVVFLDVNYDVVLKRLSGRRTCPKCSHIHNLSYGGDPDFCSVCGTKYIIRADDTEEAIKKRLNTFTTKTMPAIQYYKDKGIVIEVDANNSPQDSINQIKKGLGL